MDLRALARLQPLFVFSVLFFGIMTDAGMFDVIIDMLMKCVGDNDRCDRHDSSHCPDRSS